MRTERCYGSVGRESKGDAFSRDLPPRLDWASAQDGLGGSKEVLGEAPSPSWATPTRLTLRSLLGARGTGTPVEPSSLRGVSDGARAWKGSPSQTVGDGPIGSRLLFPWYALPGVPCALLPPPV